MRPFPLLLAALVLGLSTAAASQPAPPAMRASALLGEAVTNLNRDTVGKLEDLVIDIGNNRVHYAVLDMENRRFAYPLHMLELAEGKGLVLPEAPERRYELGGEVPSIEPRAGMALIRASELIGSGVETQPGVGIGKLVELAVDPTSGKVPFAVVSLDRASGDARLHAIPPNALETRVGRQDLVLTVDRDALQPERSFTPEQLEAGLASAEFVARHAAYAHALTPASSAAATGPTRAQGDPALFVRLDRNGDGYLEDAEMDRRIAERRNWMAMDLDGDGRISRREFTRVGRR